MNNKTYWTWNSSEGKRKIHYRKGGEGSHHLLLIHGYGSHTCTWNDLLDPLVRAGYKVWAIDLLGFGYSDKPLDSNYGIDLYIQQVVAFMQEMHISQADLITHSMGGTIGLGISIDYPDKVRSLTLISPMAYPFKFPLGTWIAKRFPALVKPFYGMAFVRFLRKQLVINAEVACTPQKIAEAVEPYLLPNGPDAALKILRRLDRQLLTEMSKRYNQIKVATLIIFGKEDLLIPSHHGNFFNRDLPHAQSWIVDQCGHIPHEEYPKEIELRILNFLKNRN